MFSAPIHIMAKVSHPSVRYFHLSQVASKRSFEDAHRAENGALGRRTEAAVRAGYYAAPKLFRFGEPGLSLAKAITGPDVETLQKALGSLSASQTETPRHPAVNRRFASVLRNARRFERRRKSPERRAVTVVGTEGG